jgi:hypothetical protein
MSAEMNIKVGMSFFRPNFGVPAPRIFQNFSILKGFPKAVPSSQFTIFQQFPELRGFPQETLSSQIAIFQTFPDLRDLPRIPIGRFSPKFFDKRRKRRLKLALAKLMAFANQIQAKFKDCEDTGVFEGLIDLIATQLLEKRTAIVCDHLTEIESYDDEASEDDRSAQQRLLIVSATDTHCFEGIQIGFSLYRPSLDCIVELTLNKF